LPARQRASLVSRQDAGISAMIKPLTLAVPEADLEDLRAWLRATRWPEPATDAGQGVALERLQERCERWAEEYDWRATERSLNAVPQYTTTIDGLGIHFLHARSPRRDAFPLVLTHGRPGSVVEFLDVLPLLIESGFHCLSPPCPATAGAASPPSPAGAWRGSPGQREEGRDLRVR
jgi:epoxide hydrolase